MTHTVTDHKPETGTLHCRENQKNKKQKQANKKNCGTKFLVATEGEKWGKKDTKGKVQYGSKNTPKTKDT